MVGLLNQERLDNLINTPQYAGFWRRWTALFIDSLLLAIVSFIGGLVIGITLGIGASMLGMDINAIKLVAGLLGQAFSIVLWWLYEALMLSRCNGQTLGKKVMGIRVTTTSGEPLSFLQATGRHFARLLCLFTLSIGYVISVFTEKKQGLHDLAANTIVTRVHS